MKVLLEAQIQTARPIAPTMTTSTGIAMRYSKVPSESSISVGEGEYDKLTSIDVADKENK